MSSAGLRKRTKGKSKADEWTFESDVLPIAKPSTSMLWQHQAALALVTAVAFLTRFVLIWDPAEVVFDEVHFGKFALYYLERTYFFDLHPPFAKLLIAFVGYIIGYSGDFKFETIGLSYPDNHVPYIPYRLLLASLGTATVLVMYLTMYELGYTPLTCAVALLLVALDTAHVCETRLILLDATLILAVASTIYCYVRFYKQRKAPFSKGWYRWLALTGVALLCVILTKYVGVFTYAMVGAAVVYDLWNLLDIKRGLLMRLVVKHTASRFTLLVVVPFIIYLFWFWVHFAILTKSGPGDAFMSSAFQETLGDLVVLREARDVHYHDIITIQHWDTKAFLHSHLANYPLRYEDGRVLSQGQQVTGYHHVDANNEWEIVPAEYRETVAAPPPDAEPGSTILVQMTTPEKQLGQVVRQGDVVRLRHVGTNGYLLTHDVALPLFSLHEEFTVVDLYKGGTDRYNDTLFRIDTGVPGGVLRTKADKFKVMHVPTKVAMWTHAQPRLPEWGFEQQEVNGHKVLTNKDLQWTVDSIVNLPAERAVFVPKTVTKLPFLAKWAELNRLMFEHNNKLSSEHPYALSPELWPFALNGVLFWNKDAERRQIFFLGNVVGFWLEMLLLLLWVGVVVVDLLTRRRGVITLTPALRVRLYDTMGFFVSGWACHYFPFFLMGRQKFLHHYLPAHLIAALFAGCFLEFLFTDNVVEDEHAPRDRPGHQTVFTVPYAITAGVFVAALAFFFVLYAPVTYGHVALLVEQVKRLSILGFRLHYSQ